MLQFEEKSLVPGWFPVFLPLVLTGSRFYWLVPGLFWTWMELLLVHYPVVPRSYLLGSLLFWAWNSLVPIGSRFLLVPGWFLVHFRSRSIFSDFHFIWTGNKLVPGWFPVQFLVPDWFEGIDWFPVDSRFIWAKNRLVPGWFLVGSRFFWASNWLVSVYILLWFQDHFWLVPDHFELGIVCSRLVPVFLLVPGCS